MQVYDRDGKLIELDDGQPVPDGCTLRVATTALLDGAQRVVFADSQRDGDDANDAARRAYQDAKDRLGNMARERMADRWRRPPSYASGGPWGDLRPQWQRDGGRPPAVGPDGRSPTKATDAAAAYEARSEWLSNRWRTHRRPFVPPRPEGDR